MAKATSATKRRTERARRALARGVESVARAIAPEKVAPAGQASLVDIDTLTEDPNNSRLHPERNIGAIKASLERFGQQKPIVHRGGIVVAGNGTLRAARELGWQRIWAVESDLTTDAQALAFAVADNRTAEIAEWDFAALAKAMETMADDGEEFMSLGWDQNEIGSIVEGIAMEDLARASGRLESVILGAKAEQAAAAAGGDATAQAAQASQAAADTASYLTLMITGPREIVEHCREVLMRRRTEQRLGTMAHALHSVVVELEEKEK